MIAWILLTFALAGAPVPEPGALPAAAILVLEAPPPGVVERLATMLAISPQVRLLPASVFPEDRQEAVRKTITDVAPYPDPLARSILDKHLASIQGQMWVVIVKEKMYIQRAGGHVDGPFPLPGPTGKLPEAFVEKLSVAAPPVKSRPSASPGPFYRNWLFWTGVGVIAGVMVAVAVVSQDPREVEVEVFHR